MLTYDIKKRVRELVLQVAEEMGIKIENGVVSSEHVHIFANIPPHIKISEFVQKAKGRSSKKIQEGVNHKLCVSSIFYFPINHI